MYMIDLQNVSEKKIYPLSQKFKGYHPSGEELAFTNYYMTKNNEPFFGISGELHFSRVDERDWRNELIKMKMGGVNIISTYIFWIHHEEVEGKFRFDGRRDLRKFIQTCAELSLKVIVRIGPFDHGEVRNGGIPDWMYGKPFETRSLDEGFLSYVERFFVELDRQFEGFYYKDGGPIIGAQIDNEYMHSAAPWEITTGISNEWISGGSDGNSYMLKIKEIARNCGIIVPFYTCTGWGGAMAPTEEMLPLWGGYAFWPWIFYSHKGEHPATPEYIYRDFHNNDVPSTYNFTPNYLPESMPYSCCEMGGGMMCSYNYRFQLPYESVAAMANIKIASGCNFLGYYMYKGGSNPLGETTPFLNEGQVCKISYDYQAAIGEFGQVRPSFHQLRLLHLFTQSFFEELSDTKTVLPKEALDLVPEDMDTLRYAVRVKGNSGFVFLNNYQDHMALREKEHESIVLQLPEEDLVIDQIGLKKGETAILPFNMNINGRILKYGTTQPVTKFTYQNADYYFFASLDGMTPVYIFENEAPIFVDMQRSSSFELKHCDKKTFVVTLSKEDSLQAYLITDQQQKSLVLSDSILLYHDGDFKIETEADEVTVLCFPPRSFNLHAFKEVTPMAKDLFQGFKGVNAHVQERQLHLSNLKKVGPTRFVIPISQDFFEGHKEVLLQIDYIGDIGHAFIDGVMISDNFYNGATWEIGLMHQREALKNNPLCIYITPLKEGANVNVESVMAGRLEEVAEAKGSISKIRLKYRNEIQL